MISPMDVLTPRSFREALTMKAERPEAVPLQGGTDLLVELNFDRRRPGLVLNLAELDEEVGSALDREGIGPLGLQPERLVERPRRDDVHPRTVRRCVCCSPTPTS